MNSYPWRSIRVQIVQFGVSGYLPERLHRRLVLLSFGPHVEAVWKTVALLARPESCVFAVFGHFLEDASWRRAAELSLYWIKPDAPVPAKFPRTTFVLGWLVPSTRS